MLQMQQKLEIIENKLNSFMKSSPQRSDIGRESQSVLGLEENKFLKQARNLVYSKFDEHSSTTKSYRSSLNEDQEKTVKSDQAIFQTCHYK